MFFWQAFEASHLPALMTVLRNEGRWDRSNAIYADGRVVLYDKNQAPGMSYFADASSEVFDLAALLHQLSLDGRLAGYEVTERFYEVGSAAGLQELDRYLADREPVPTTR
jgi:hypothetical protein